MLLFQSIRALSSFWEFGEMVFLIPAALWMRTVTVSLTCGRADL